MRCGDLDPGRTVHRRKNNMVHLRPSCHQIRHDLRPVEAGLLHPDTPVCGYCSGESNHSEKMRDCGRHGHDGDAALLESVGPEDVGLSPVGER